MKLKTKLKKIEDYTTVELSLIIVVIILIFPFLFTIPALVERFDYSESGQIGDTVGGVTAPFINGLAAILVFAAFKAQISANEIFKNQEMSRTILEQIKIIQEDSQETQTAIVGLNNRLSHLSNPSNIDIVNIINKIIFFTSEIRLASELIEKFPGEKDFLYRKLHYLYVIRHKDFLTELSNRIKQVNIHKDYEGYAYELQFEIEYLSDKLEKLDKYENRA